jgi:serine protease
VSATQLNFDTMLDTLAFSAVNAGSGALFINSATDNVPWLTITPASGNAPLSLRARVDRSALLAGTYTGRITIASNASQNPGATVDVTVKVSAVGAGNVGTVFVLILNSQSFTTVGQAETSVGQGYEFAIPAIPPEVYFVIAGTDRDDNGFICEEEDACGLYPDLVTITSGQSTPTINFTVANFVTSPAPSENSGPLRLQRLR